MVDPFWQRASLRELAAHGATPLLVVSEERLRANVRDLIAGLGPGVTIRYCAKTNPELRVLEIVREEGAHVLASHEAEAALAIAAGFAPEQVAFQRPVLDERELSALIAMGCRRLHAFRLTDLDQLSRAALRHGVTLRVSLRIALPRRGMFMLGASSKRLGLDPSEVNGVAREGIVVDALNTYIGTQQEDVEAYRPALRRLAEIASRLESIEELNLGGGIPSATIRRVTPGRLLRRDRNGKTTSLRDYAASLRALFDEEVRKPMRLALEPGRAIAGNAAVLLTRVAARQGRWCFLDAGRNVMVESPLAFTRSFMPVDVRGGSTSRVHFSGPTLNTLDVLDMNRRSSELREGDLVAIGDAGAYAMSRATRYAGLSPAVVLMRMDGTVDTIRRAESADDFTATMVRR